MIKAVIFDLDGVLVDSEPVYLEHEYQKIKRYLPNITKEEMMPTVGMSSKMFHAFVSNLLGLDSASEQYQEYRQGSYVAFKVDYKEIMRSSVVETLTKLKQMNYRIALASSGDMEDILKTLDQCEIRDFFEVICSGDMFHESKPNPEIYLTTFAKLGVEPEQCLVVEDSNLGLAAARASGAVVCCMKETRFLFTQEDADYYIDDLSEIIGILSKQVKAIFFDIDGTLTDMATHEMPKSTEIALQKLKDNNVKIFICTGRALVELRTTKMLDDSLFDGAIYMNGQYCIYDGKIVLDFPLTKEQICAVKKYVTERNISCNFFTDNDTFVNMVDERLITAQQAIGTPIPRIECMDHIEDLRIYQACPSVNEQEEKELGALIEGVKTTRWSSFGIDVVAKDAGKDKGIKGIAEYLGLDLRETMSFGDGHNDIPMLETTMISVAMGNAVDELKEKASYITDCLNEDGVYNALKYFEIIN